MALPGTALSSHGDVDPSAKEVYGRGSHLLRVGNGGAGATGLVKALTDEYIRSTSEDITIQWICNHSRNTQLALLYGYIDIALTYERDQEALAAAEGWSTTVGCVFHDHFCLAGPASDPANIRSTSTLEEAFATIAQSKALFHSRADASATMWKERSIWEKCGLEPWAETQAALSGWYKTSVLSPSEALTTSDAAGAYLLTDRSTLLRQTALQVIRDTTVFYEPTSPGDVLMNSCYALTSTHASAEPATPTSRFLDWLFSERGQDVVAAFGKEELGGFPLFTPAREGFATSFLKGGMPRDGRWRLLGARSRL